MANKINDIPGRALEIANQVGETIRDRIPGISGTAVKWIETGAALGAIKAGTRVASGFVRRNPVVAAATAAGAGLLWYVARRRAKQAQQGPIEGTATRIEAKRADTAPRTRRTATGKRPSARRTTTRTSKTT